MTSLFEVRSKATSSNELKISFESFLKSAQVLKRAKRAMMKTPGMEGENSKSTQHNTTVVILPRLVMLELDIFSNSVERNNLRDQNVFCDGKFSQLFKNFHAKRKNFLQSCRIKGLLREKTEVLKTEVSQLRFFNKKASRNGPKRNSFLHAVRFEKNRHGIHR
jgi:hypothetical protein